MNVLKRNAIRQLMIVFLLFLCALLQAQRYKIQSVEYEIDGVTREDRLSRAVSINTTYVFPNLQAFEKYLSDLQIRYQRQRVLQSAIITPTYGEPDEQNIIFVDLLINIEDSWNVIPLPYPKFDFTLVDVYGIHQTKGKVLESTSLNDVSMVYAINALLKCPPWPLKIQFKLGKSAYYHHETNTLETCPMYSGKEAFACIATEVSYAMYHAQKGAAYSRELYRLNAESISYILCQSFGVKRALPDVTYMNDFYKTTFENTATSHEDFKRANALNRMQKFANEMGKAIELELTSEQQKKRIPKYHTR